MKYTLYLILFIILLPHSAPVWAQSSRYRVELLVLSHLDHQAAPIEEPALTDYTAALDLLAPPAGDEADTTEATDPVGALPSPAVPAAQGTGEPPTGETADELPPDPASLVLHLPEPGPEMQEAWRRLRLSGPFRPLRHLAWEQSGDGPFPVLRLHDDDVVLTEDPWAALRDQAADEAGAIVFADPAGLADAAGANAEELPEPRVHYRLDGTAELRRSRFLHLHLDFEWREPVFAPQAMSGPTGTAEIPGSVPAPGKIRSAGLPDQAIVAAAEPAPSAYLVHRLQQNRQIKTGRLIYFDSPVLGVLALVTDVSDQYAEQPAPPEATE